MMKKTSNEIRLDSVHCLYVIAVTLRKPHQNQGH